MYYIDCGSCQHSFSMDGLNCKSEECALYCWENNTRVKEYEFCKNFVATILSNKQN